MLLDYTQRKKDLNWINLVKLLIHQEETYFMGSVCDITYFMVIQWLENWKIGMPWTLMNESNQMMYVISDFMIVDDEVH